MPNEPEHESDEQFRENLQEILREEYSSGESHDVVHYYVDEHGRLKGDRRRADKVLLRIKNLEEAQVSLNKKLEMNTAITQKVSMDTDQLLELFVGFRTLFKVMAVLSKFARWLLGTLLAMYGLYLLFRGKPPTDMDIVNPFK